MNSFLEERDIVEYDSLMSLADLIVIRLPGCDDELVRKYISLTYRDFAKRSCILRTRRTIELEHDKCDYHVCPMIAGCDVDCVVRVFWHGFPIEYAQEMDCIRINTHRLPRKDEKWTIEVECIEVPRLGEERAPAMVIRKYGDAIVSGALMQLMRMTGKAWSDPQQAALEAVNYENALTENRMRHYGNGCGGANYFKKGLVL